MNFITIKNQQQDAITELEDKIMGYKILDVKADIHEDVEGYMRGYDSLPDAWKDIIKDDILDIVDKHFEKIEK